MKMKIVPSLCNKMEKTAAVFSMETQQMTAAEDECHNILLDAVAPEGLSLSACMSVMNMASDPTPASLSYFFNSFPSPCL